MMDVNKVLMDVEEKLNDPDALDEWLQRKAGDYVGLRRSANACPIHLFLGECFPNIEDFWVTPAQTHIFIEGSESNTILIRHPRWVRNFIRRVDNGSPKSIMGKTALKILERVKREEDESRRRVGVLEGTVGGV